jgi:hypothetical protein
MPGGGDSILSHPVECLCESCQATRARLVDGVPRPFEQFEPREPEPGVVIQGPPA